MIRVKFLILTKYKHDKFNKYRHDEVTQGSFWDSQMAWGHTKHAKSE